MTAPKSKIAESGTPTGDESIARASSGSDPAVRKVAPYPIDVEISKVEGQPVPLQGQILKLTDVGFLMKVNATHFYKVGENYSIYFEIPVVGFPVETIVRVVKTYDAMEVVTKNQKTKMYTIEMHFKNLPSQDKTNINSFLVKIGQKKF